MSKRIAPADILWIVLWVVMVGGVAGAMFAVRHNVLQSAGVHSQQDWEEWREAVQASQTKDGPVQRRVPKSDEPPAVVLLRDHFAVCLSIALVLSAVLFGTFVLFARGVLNWPGPQISLPSLPPESPADDRR